MINLILQLNLQNIMKDYLFEDSGTHVMIIRHGMRKNELHGFVKLGVEID